MIRDIGIIIATMVVCLLIWMASAGLISFAIQRYFELKEEYLARVSAKVVRPEDEFTEQHVQ